MNFEDKLEEAYWELDALKKGYNRPQQSERDAFKQIVRKLFREQKDEDTNQ